MSSIPIQNVAFDDAATSAMGKAFDQACKSLRDFGSAAEIIANLIIAAAKDGERDPARLYEHVLNAFGIEDVSMLVVSVGTNPPSQPTLRSRMQRDLREPGRPRAGLSLAPSRIAQHGDRHGYNRASQRR